jgi:hypothetical protein
MARTYSPMTAAIRNRTRKACHLAAFLTEAGITADSVDDLDEVGWGSAGQPAGFVDGVSLDTRTMVRALLDARAEGVW